LKLEALRYSYLGKKSNIIKLNSVCKVLILGDFDKNKTYKILELIKSYFEEYDCKIEILFRPHPNFIINNTNYKKLKFQISKDRIENDFFSVNFVIASDSTSAALDAYCYGLKLAVVKDTKGLCQSPLYGLNDVKFISTVDELHEALLSASWQNNDIQSKQHFYYEENLKNWKNLIMGDK
jgi:surface carbohydrate biosynthesis protein (TIGR04326 family)